MHPFTRESNAPPQHQGSGSENHVVTMKRGFLEGRRYMIPCDI